MAYKTMDSLIYYFENDLYSDPDEVTDSDAVESLKRQIKSYQGRGYDIMNIDLMNITGHAMQIWSKYPLE